MVRLITEVREIEVNLGVLTAILAESNMPGAAEIRDCIVNGTESDWASCDKSSDCDGCTCCMNCIGCERCYDCMGCEDCTWCDACDNCVNCHNCEGLADCVGWRNNEEPA